MPLRFLTRWHRHCCPDCLTRKEGNEKEINIWRAQIQVCVISTKNLNHLKGQIKKETYVGPGRCRPWQPGAETLWWGWTLLVSRWHWCWKRAAKIIMKPERVLQQLKTDCWQECCEDSTQSGLLNTYFGCIRNLSCDKGKFLRVESETQKCHKIEKANPPTPPLLLSSVWWYNILTFCGNMIHYKRTLNLFA